MNKRLALFLACHTGLWTLLPLLRKSLPMDSMEAILWGNFWEWGTNKHPPVSGVLIAPLYSALCESPVAVYLLSQLCILIALWFTYKLGKLFLTKNQAVLATMLMEGILYYTLLSCEYNVNIVSLALWPVNTYYFFRAMQKNRTKHWFLLGLTAGLNLLTKYTGGALLAAFGAYLLATKNGRAQFKRVGPYITFVVCCLVVAPHILWLVKYNFYILTYMAMRSVDRVSSWTDHFYFPVKFLVSQIVTSFGALAVFAAFRFGRGEQSAVSHQNKTFLLFVGILPLLILALVSVVTAVPLRSMWGTPFMYLTTVMLFAFFPIRFTPRTEAWFVRIVYVGMVVGAVAYVASITLKTREKVLMDSVVFAHNMTDIWNEKTNNAPLKYVGGDIWYASHMALFAPQRPTMTADDLKMYPWLDGDDILDKGVLIMSAEKPLCSKYAPGKTTVPVAYSHTFKARFAEPRTWTFYYCFVMPKGQGK